MNRSLLTGVALTPDEVRLIRNALAFRIGYLEERIRTHPEDQLAVDEAAQLRQLDGELS